MDNSAPLWFTTIHILCILNRHDPGSAQVGNSFALTEYWQLTL